MSTTYMRNNFSILTPITGILLVGFIYFSITLFISITSYFIMVDLAMLSHLAGLATALIVFITLTLVLGKLLQRIKQKLEKLFNPVKYTELKQQDNK